MMVSVEADVGDSQILKAKCCVRFETQQGRRVTNVLLL